MSVLIIGNGIAGYSAAYTIKQLHKSTNVTIVAKEIQPLYSACVLPHYIAGKIDRERTFVRTRHDYNTLGVRTKFGYEAKEIDTGRKCVTLENGELLIYDKLILALGSHAIHLGQPGNGIFTLKTLGDADRLIKHEGKKSVVVGSGSIGLEIAAALKERGNEVTVIVGKRGIIPLGLDDPAALHLQKILEQNGIDIIMGERRPIEAQGKDTIEGLLIGDDRVDCDTLVWAIGMRPNVELAKRAGITIGPTGGIKVHTNMETSAADVYACGDCVEACDVITGRPALNLFWHNANRQGKIAARSCMNVATCYQGSQNIVNLEVFGNQIVGFGYTEKALRAILGFKDKIVEGPGRIYVREKEQNARYQRLVFLDKRCMGAQFINPGKDLGMLWKLISCRENMETLNRSLENEALMSRKKYLYRVKEFL